ncbi:MAG: ribbon-helix-helix domain-containing protein [Cellulomonadaceae bacterium]|jgi:hypothetical protein|nr:ribbon-helix-helix domain-containing protein [Cellulomonadaceae bacterium]
MANNWNPPRMTPEEAEAYLAQFSDADFESMTVSSEEDISEAQYERLVEAAHKIPLPGRPSLTEPGETSPQIVIRLPAQMNAQLAKLSEQTGERRSTIVRKALGQYLAGA